MLQKNRYMKQNIRTRMQQVAMKQSMQIPVKATIRIPQASMRRNTIRIHQASMKLNTIHMRQVDMKRSTTRMRQANMRRNTTHMRQVEVKRNMTHMLPEVILIQYFKAIQGKHTRQMSVFLRRKNIMQPEHIAFQQGL